MSTLKHLVVAAAIAASTGGALAAPASFQIDPAHTYPSFEADHMGISTLRGKLNRSSGTLQFDKASGSGSVDVTVELASIDFGLEALNTWARGEQLFDVKKFPHATYRGSFSGPAGAMPTEVRGELTLHGVTKPLRLTVHQIKCVPHPLFKRELCGADASATFKRDEFGLGAGKDYGFDMNVLLRIQIEAVAVQ